MFQTYAIWKQNHSSPEWTKTSHEVKARTPEEAQKKLKRKFQHAGFSSMSLVALPEGVTPIK